MTERPPLGSRSRGDLTRGTTLGNVLWFGLPLVIGMAGHALFNLVDLFMVAQGVNRPGALGAVHLATTINMVPMVLYNGIATASIALIARAFGAGDRSRAAWISNQGMVVCLVAGVVLGAAFYLVAEDLIDLFRPTEAMRADAIDYLEIVSLGTITMFLLMQITAAQRGVGNSVLPLFILTASNVLNMVLDYLFIFGVGPFKPMGVAGAAWATVVSRLVGSAWGLYLLWSRTSPLRLKLRELLPRARILFELHRLGIPASGQLVIRVLAVVGLTWIITDVIADPGDRQAALDAFGIAIRLDILALFSALGWGTAAATLVGQNLGAEKAHRAVAATWVAITLNVAMMGAIGGAFIAWAEPIIAFFNTDPRVLDYGAHFLKIVAPSYLFLAFTVVLSQALNGAGSTRAPMLIDLCFVLLLQLPVAYVLASWGPLGERIWGVYLTYSLFNVLLALVYTVWFNKGYWKSLELRSTGELGRP
ncbi:MAG: MATE family efflux transporter [Planctomycetes bacterium]|nr:MATE family efflux transporter [Planctomycetota bacterium]